MSHPCLVASLFALWGAHSWADTLTVGPGEA